MTSISELAENLLVYAQQELFLSEEGTAFARNQLLELLQAEPAANPGTYPENIEELLEALTDYACSESIIEEESRSKFASKLMNIVMPSQDDVSHTYATLHRDDGSQKAAAYFRQVVQASRYCVDRTSRTIGWVVESKRGTTMFLIPPPYEQKTYGTYPACPLCIENLGFPGMPGETANYSKRVLPMDLGGEKWIFSYAKEPVLPDEFIVSFAEHKSCSDDKQPQRMLDFAEKFTDYFVVDLPDAKEHNYFFGAKKILPMFTRQVLAPFFRNDDILISHRNWLFSNLYISSVCKGTVLRTVRRLVKDWNAAQTGNIAFPFFHATRSEYIADVILLKNYQEATLFDAPLNPLAFAGVFILDSSLRNDIVDLVDFLADKKPDFVRMNDTVAMRRYMGMVAQVAAANPNIPNKETCRSLILEYINKICTEDIPERTFVPEPDLKELAKEIQ